MSFSCLRLNPADIRYGQSSIRGTFSDRTSLLSTMKQLLSRQITPENLPEIEVVFYKNNFYVTNGNRRLFLFKKLARDGLPSEIPVLLSSTKVPGKITTKNDGRFIKIRGRQELDAEINSMIEKHLLTENHWTSSDDDNHWTSSDDEYTHSEYTGIIIT